MNNPMTKAKKFWNWKTVKNEGIEVRTLYLNGIIAKESWYDDDVTPGLFKDELTSGSGDIEVWINSPGGDCIAASQIYNMLMDYKGNVTVKIDGLAASAASVIAMAGTKTYMSPTAIMMIHNPFTIAEGTADDMEKVIQMLEQVKESIINAYQLKSGLSHKKISEMMNNETWFSAKVAVELGLADDMLFKDKQKNKKAQEETDEPDKEEKEQDDDEDEDEDDEPKKPLSFSFSTRQVENTVLNKVSETIKVKEKPTGIPADQLMTRLNLIK